MLEFSRAGDWCDVTLKCQGVSFRCHKVVLASHSPVFEAMFRNECLESSTNVVEVRDVGAESLGDVVAFMYSGEVKGKEKKRLREVMTVADMYMIDVLKIMCQELLEDDGEGREVQ